MKHQEFIPGNLSANFEKGAVSWQAPSNIALVKYWGKKESQVPANASISFTLTNCKTTTRLKFVKKERPSKNIDFEIYFEGDKKESFRPKIDVFFQRIVDYCPYLNDFKFTIESENSFPHSSGIASSASAMAALALCLMSLEKKMNPEMDSAFFQKKASFLARLGSGSACRSILGQLIVWGQHSAVEGSSSLFGVKLPGKVHPVFNQFQDTILLIDKGQKKVSSSVGHQLMQGHPFAQARFQQADENLKKLISVLKNGDLQKFIEIVENEALSLHAMMLSSVPYFILMKPKTLEVIQKIWNFREETGLPVCFSLDAGANVHILYPKEYAQKILEFIKAELVVYCENGQYICDVSGDGALLKEN